MKCLTMPNGPLSIYDATEMAGVVEHDGVVERVTDGTDPHYWSVYLHAKEGGVECVADFDDQVAAENFALFLDVLLGRA